MKPFIGKLKVSTFGNSEEDYVVVEEKDDLNYYYTDGFSRWVSIPRILIERLDAEELQELINAEF